MRSIGEKCGVFGVFGPNLDASRITFFGLYALQHRGQESSGIAASDGTQLTAHRDMGLVSHVFGEETIRRLAGAAAIGHNRYSTTGGSKLDHAQPVLVNDGAIALAHNGNIPDTTRLAALLKEAGVDTQDLNDSDMMAEAIGYLSRNGRPDRGRDRGTVRADGWSLLGARPDAGQDDRLPRPVRHPAARHRQAQWRLRPLVRDLRVPPGRSYLPARRAPGRNGRGERVGAEIHPGPARPPEARRIRVRLFLPPGQHAPRPIRLRRAPQMRDRARPGISDRGGRGDPGARDRDPGGHRLSPPSPASRSKWDWSRTATSTGPSSSPSPTCASKASSRS